MENSYLMYFVIFILIILFIVVGSIFAQIINSNNKKQIEELQNHLNKIKEKDNTQQQETKFTLKMLEEEIKNLRKETLEKTDSTIKNVKEQVDKAEKIIEKKSKEIIDIATTLATEKASSSVKDDLREVIGIDRKMLQKWDEWKEEAKEKEEILKNKLDTLENKIRKVDSIVRSSTIIKVVCDTCGSENCAPLNHDTWECFECGNIWKPKK